MAQNILDLLRREHAKVLGQLDELQRRGINDRAEKFNQMKNNLLPHMAGEERVFYPRLEERGLHDLVAGSREEHTAIRALVARLSTIPSGDEGDWVQMMPELREAMRSHVDREEKMVFPVARQKMDDLELLRIGGRFEEAKGEGSPAATQMISRARMDIRGSLQRGIGKNRYPAISTLASPVQSGKRPCGVSWVLGVTHILNRLILITRSRPPFSDLVPPASYS